MHPAHFRYLFLCFLLSPTPGEEDDGKTVDDRDGMLANLSHKHEAFRLVSIVRAPQNIADHKIKVAIALERVERSLAIGYGDDIDTQGSQEPPAPHSRPRHIVVPQDACSTQDVKLLGSAFKRLSYLTILDSVARHR